MRVKPNPFGHFTKAGLPKSNKTAQIISFEQFCVWFKGDVPGFYNLVTWDD